MIVRYSTVLCDRCGENEAGSEYDADVARFVASTAGWQVRPDGGRGGADVCPDCRHGAINPTPGYVAARLHATVRIVRNDGKPDVAGILTHVSPDGSMLAVAKHSGARNRYVARAVVAELHPVNIVQQAKGAAS